MSHTSSLCLPSLYPSAFFIIKAEDTCWKYWLAAEKTFSILNIVIMNFIFYLMLITTTHSSRKMAEILRDKNVSCMAAMVLSKTFRGHPIFTIFFNFLFFGTVLLTQIHTPIAQKKRIDMQNKNLLAYSHIL